MKKLIRIPALIFLSSLVICCFIQTAVAQQTDGYKIVSEKVAKKEFVFVAESVSPLSGKLRVLTSRYDVSVKKDSIISYLPYFGKSYSAPINTDEAGIMFTSTGFDYTAKEGKKRTWEVEIKFKDQRITQEFNFSIYDDGSAYLHVTSNSRDPISFRGSIKL